MVFEVLAKVALVACLSNGVAHTRQFYEFKFSQFGYKLVVALL